MSDEIPANSICAEIIRTGIERRTRKRQSSLAQLEKWNRRTTPNKAVARDGWVRLDGVSRAIVNEWARRSGWSATRIIGALVIGVRDECTDACLAALERDAIGREIVWRAKRRAAAIEKGGKAGTKAGGRSAS